MSTSRPTYCAASIPLISGTHAEFRSRMSNFAPTMCGAKFGHTREISVTHAELRSRIRKVAIAMANVTSMDHLSQLVLVPLGQRQSTTACRCFFSIAATASATPSTVTMMSVIFNPTSSNNFIMLSHTAIVNMIVPSRRLFCSTNCIPIHTGTNRIVVMVLVPASSKTSTAVPDGSDLPDYDMTHLQTKLK